jgi:isoquinoline 1-oxidoreductase beta subunit
MNDPQRTRPATLRNPRRRQFLVDTAWAGGGLALGLSVPDAATAADAAAGSELNVWVVVRPDDVCVVRFARTEMGQGTLTGLAQLVAEELDCDWAKIATESVTPGRNFAAQRAWGEMGTGGSRGIRTSQDYVRRGGAAARLMLMQAAAAQWQVPVAELSTDAGVIRHPASGRTLRYGQMAGAAARLPAPDLKSIVLKDPKTWKIAGHPKARLDTRDKTNGSKVYGVDVQLPGQLCAAISACPVWGGKLTGFDAAAISGRPGVRGVVRVNDGAVAVVADTWWRARSALQALPVVWEEGPSGQESSATIGARLAAALSADNVFADRNEGDAPAALAGAARKLEATYSTPFLAHATMEPMNCTVRLGAERAEAWVPTQNAEAAHAALSEVSGLPLSQCEVYRLDPGGGFGRRGGSQDYVRQAVVVAKAFPGVPIKLIWSREEDTTHDFYRPVSMCKLSAGLDAAGDLVALQVRVSGPSINAFVAPLSVTDGKDRRQLQGMWREPGDAQLGYTVPNLRVEYAMRNTHVPVGPWRGVNTNQNGVYIECFIDEVARAAGADPLAFRRKLMGSHPKHRAVLEAAAQKAGWGQPLPPGVHRGIAQFMGYASYSAAVAEVSVDAKGAVTVHRMVLALNCGHAVNPGQIAAQVEGSVAFGLSAVFHGEITIANGRAVQRNFDTYPLLRLAAMPPVETVIVPSFDFWGGVGEPTICVVAPAVLNAIHAATGKPVRSLPYRAAA